MALHTIVEHDTTHIKPYIDNVKQALSNEVATRATLGAHNILNFPNSDVHGNNSVTETFDSTNQAYSYVGTGGYARCDFICRNILEVGKKYIISYKTKATLASENEIDVGISADESNIYNANTWIVRDRISATQNDFVEKSFEFTAVIKDCIVAFYIQYGSGSGNTLLIKDLMIRLATDSDTTYRPYVPTNSQLLSYKDNGVLGAKNLGKKYNGVTNIGLTFKDAPDGGNYVNGTATTSGGRLNLKSDNFVLKAGTYSIVGESNDHSKYSTVVLQKTSDNSVLGLYEISNGAVDKSQATVTLAADTECFFGFNTYGGTAYGTDTFIIYPMVKLADDKDDTFYPYAMTNKQLTDNKIDASEIAPIENGTTASTAYEQGAYFIHNGKFCKAKTAIASDAPFTLNTNYEVTTVAAELIALNS